MVVCMDDKEMPWVTHKHIWKTQSSFMSWLRSGIRKSLWSRSPIKLEFMKKTRKMIDNPKKGTRCKPRVWGGQCNICKNDFPQNQLEVDHVIGNHSLREITDIQQFIMSIVMVQDKDLQYLCKGCHTVKTHSEKYNLSFDDAFKEKKIIAYGKLKPVKQIEILEKYNKPHNNAKIRKQSFSEIIDELDMI